MNALYFIKGDSAENWGAMKLTLKKNGNASRAIWQAAQDGWTCVGAREFNAWRKKYSKPSVHPTLHAADKGDSPAQKELFSTGNNPVSSDGTSPAPCG